MCPPKPIPALTHSRDNVVNLVCPAAPARIDKGLAESATKAEAAAVELCAREGVASFKSQ